MRCETVSGMTATRPRLSPRHPWIAFGVLALASCAFTSEVPPAVDVTARVATGFSFRGQLMTDRPVFQAATNVQLTDHHDGVTAFSAWGNMNLTDSVGDAWFRSESAGEFTQVDLATTHSRTFGPVAVTVGVESYTWANGEQFPFGPFPSTSELFATVGGGEVAGFRPSVTVHYDIDEVEGLYVAGDLQREFELMDDVRLLLRGGMGWSDADHSRWLYRTDANALADADLEARFLWQADEVTSVQIGVRGSTIVDNGLRDWFARNRVDADQWIVGLGVAWAF